MISTANITMQFGAKPLFENISVKFGGGNRYGLIGANGCGKSTFMKILGGDLDQSSGNVKLDENERLGKLRQDQFAFETNTVIDTVIMGHAEMWTVKEERDAIYANPDMSEADGMRVGDLESEFAEMDGYTAESRAGELLIGVGIPVELHYGLMSEVAPGWKLRVLLAQALFSDPDILLLDEPTNNLDIATIDWLEETLNARQSTMVIISHDRHFLNSVCTHMADLDFGELRVYPGNYDDYMFAAALAREQLLTSNSKKEAQITELKAFVARFSANASKAKQASSRAKRLDKIELDEVKVSSRQTPFIRFEQEKQLYRNALEVQGLTKGFDEGPLFSNFKSMVEVGERIAIIGTNGVGKTTLMRMLADELTPDAGEYKWSENVNIAYYAQDHESYFEEDLTLMEWMNQWKEKGDDDQTVRGFLGRLLFSNDDISKKVSVLSGGEKGRMLYGKLMMQRPNVLLMDEPTNHMDMESIEALNMSLEKYEGTLLFISHDREFVSTVATRIWDITPNGIVDFDGTYEEYLASK
ncbi:ABC-F family ATPase [Moritella marina ATCC 15381]|uniref:Probable ATP-binding protein YbiT n=1 Tax=Moritella marina ATCC 15381 TaxID=1202962 RepID=A0A5J6WKD2_MORMI|nr:ABC-F family ATPase [Moritella marina]QFI38563.1 ABC-F family ATPase [Moritella marina ATCC 15381]